MARALPIKTKRRATAAYAASQPLFDTLRNGMQRLEDQRGNLETARDAVQKLHVKLPSTSIADDVQDGHETYMDGAVKAWRLATESYADIFQTLADVTAAEPDAGRRAKAGHAAFAQMASTARAAHEAAMDWKMTTPPSSAEGSDAQSAPDAKEDEVMQDINGGSEAAQSSEEESGSTKAAAAAPTDSAAAPSAGAADNRPINPVLMSLLQDQKASKVRQPSMASESPKDRTEPLNEQHDKGQGGEQGLGRSQKRLAKRKKRREMREQARTQGTDGRPAKATSERARADDHIAPPQKEAHKKPKPAYDDVSAEVAARLAAKDAKPSKNKEKKRKRDSRDSQENGGQVVVKAEKPKKKKAKSNTGEAVDDTTKEEQARKHGRSAEAGADGDGTEGRKKRRKA